MDLEPAYAGIRKLHPTDPAHSRQKLFMFLSGWMGAPERGAGALLAGMRP